MNEAQHFESNNARKATNIVVEYDCPNRLVDSTEEQSTGGGCLAITGSVRLEVVLEGR